MNILIISMNYAPEEIGIGPQSAALAQHLASSGNKVRVICTYPYYPLRQLFLAQSAYVPHHPNIEIKRIWSYSPTSSHKSSTLISRFFKQLTFTLLALPMVLIWALTFRPKINIAIAPGIISAPLAIVSALLAKGISHLHVQDIEASAANIMGRSKLSSTATNLLTHFTKKLVHTFDTVSTISTQMGRELSRITERHDLQITPNGFMPEQIFPQDRDNNLRKTWKIQAQHIILYSGNIGKKQGLEVILEAAAKTISNPNIIYLIVGEGSYAQELKLKAQHFPNILFKPLQPTSKLNALLSLATIHLLPQAEGFGASVFPSKLINMLASGRPIIAICDQHDEIIQYVSKCGRTLTHENKNLLANTVLEMCENTKQMEIWGEHARLLALLYFNSRQIHSDFETHLLKEYRAKVTQITPHPIKTNTLL